MAGCGSSTDLDADADASQNSSSATEGDAATDKTTLVFEVNGGDTGVEEYWTGVIEAYEKENPDVDVQLAVYDEFDTKVNSEYAAGNAPDIMYDTLMAQGTRVPLGQYADLTEYVNNWDEWDDFLDNAAALGSLDGVQYGIPLYADARVFVYNKDLLKEAGIESVPTTWEELLKDQELLTKKDADGNVTQVGLSIPTTGTQLTQFYSAFAEQNGLSNLIDESTDEILFNTDAGIEAAEYLKQLYDIGGLTWDSADSTLDPFQSGKAAFTITTTTGYKQALDAGLNVGVASPLSNEKQATFCGMRFLYVSSTCENVDAAFDFISYASSADNAWSRYEDLKYIPLRKSLREQYIAENPDENEAFFDSIAAGTGSPRKSYTATLNSLVQEAFESIYLGYASVDEAFQNAADQLQVEIDNQ